LHYFDHNATSTMLPVAKEAWLNAADLLIGNASSLHRVGQRADRALEAARETFAKILGCHALDLIWTSGATESANTVMQHLGAIHPDDRPIWVSAIEHPCVLESALHYFKERVVFIPVDQSGVINLEWIRSNIREARPVAVVVMAANNETGVLQPWDAARDMCHEHKIPIVCDATQWIGRLPASELGRCDWLFGSAHKSGGPKGVGFLKCAAGERLNPLIHGGGQQEHRRAGTENVVGIVSWEAALKWCEQQLAEGADVERSEWREEFIRAVRGATHVAAPNGSDADCLWNTVGLELPAPDCQQLWTVKLDRAGYAVSSGSACASGDEKPSHVLVAMGRDNDQIRRTVRMSSGWETTRDQWRSLAGAIETIRRTWPSLETSKSSISNA